MLFRSIELLTFGHPRGSLLERVAGSWLRERFAETVRVNGFNDVQARAEDVLDVLD